MVEKKWWYPRVVWQNTGGTHPGGLFEAYVPVFSKILFRPTRVLPIRVYLISLISWSLKISYVFDDFFLKLSLLKKVLNLEAIKIVD